jgi:hypothetical protein
MSVTALHSPKRSEYELEKRDPTYAESVEKANLAVPFTRFHKAIQGLKNLD